MSTRRIINRISNMEISFLRQTASVLDQGGRAEGRGAALQWNLAARAASKRSNCKGPPGLPCAVTPKWTWPPRAPSTQNTIITVLRTSVCPVRNSYKRRAKTNVRPSSSALAVVGATVEASFRAASNEPVIPSVARDPLFSPRFVGGRPDFQSGPLDGSNRFRNL